MVHTASPTLQGRYERGPGENVLLGIHLRGLQSNVVKLSTVFVCVASVWKMKTTTETSYWGHPKSEGAKTKAKGILRRHQAPHCPLCQLISMPHSLHLHWTQIRFRDMYVPLTSSLQMGHKAKATESQRHFFFPYLSPTPSLLLKYTILFSLFI